MPIWNRLPYAGPTRRINYGLADLKGDAFGGITAGALMLPIAMGYGIVAGLGSVAGLYGAIVACLASGVCGGTRGMISGPNLVVAVAVATAVGEYADNLAEALTIVMLAGLIQAAFGVLGLGRYVSYIPYSLMSGIFTAVGILIVVTQTLPSLGAPQVYGVVAGIRAWPQALAHINLHAAAVAGISIAVVMVWPRRLARFAPTQFAAIVMAALAGALVFKNAPVIGPIPTILPDLQMPVLSAGLMLRALEPAFIIAFLGSVSTLMGALYVDSITGDHHQPNREIVGQGIGTVAAGLVGGLPGAMSIASLTNLASGGRTRVANFVAAITLLLMVIGIRPVAESIPHAAFSGILIIIGWQYVDRRFIVRMHRIPRDYVLVAVTTVLLALIFNFVHALLIGWVIAALTSARRFEKSELERVVSLPLLDLVVLGDEVPRNEVDPFQARTALVIFPDRVSAASARELSRTIGRDIEGQPVVIFDLSRTVYIDDTAVAMIGQLVATSRARWGRRFIIIRPTGDVANVLNAMGLQSWIPSEHFADDLEEAKRIARPMLLRLTRIERRPADGV